MRRGLLSPLAPGVYGLPANSTVLREALLKEAVHDLGHSPPLAHCEDYQCVMLPPWSRVDRLENQPILHFVPGGRDESLGWRRTRLD